MNELEKALWKKYFPGDGMSVEEVRKIVELSCMK